MEGPEIEAKLRMIGEFLRSNLPKNTGFCLTIHSLDGKETSYVSSFGKEGIIIALNNVLNHLVRPNA